MFPAFTNASNAQGGVKNLGPTGNRNIWYQKPTFNQSLTWVRNNHTYKFGAEVRFEGVPTLLYTSTNGVYSFSAAETALPYLNTTSAQRRHCRISLRQFSAGSGGFRIDRQPPTARVGQNAWGFFAQDSWKISRKLTLDYGLRYDYRAYPKEQYGRYPDFSPTMPNPSAGGLPGAVIFEGTARGTAIATLGKVLSLRLRAAPGCRLSDHSQDCVSRRLWCRVFRHAHQQPDHYFHLASRAPSVQPTLASPP